VVVEPFEDFSDSLNKQQLAGNRGFPKTSALGKATLNLLLIKNLQKKPEFALTTFSPSC
jgi:hypothetical protein